MMKIGRILSQSGVLALSVFLLSACTTPSLYYKTEANVKTVQDRTKDAEKTADEQTAATPVVTVKDGLYVDQTPIDLSTQPAWLKARITLQGDTLPFSFYSHSIVRAANVLTRYQSGLDDAKLLSMNYAGDVKGALDMLAAKTGFVYTIEGNTVNWYALVTQTFSVAFMPGSSNYLVGKDKGSDTTQSASSGGGGGDTIVSQISDSFSQSQYSNLAGKLSVWNDLNSTIQTMLSDKGQAVVSESTSSITVTDRPSNVATIAAYIKQINKDLSKQVMIKVQVLQVTLNDSFNNGINWNVVTRYLSTDKSIKFTGDFSQPVSVSPVAGVTSAALGLQNADSTSFVLINALSQQGRVSVTTEPTVVTTNNQVASINITEQTGYLARLSSVISDTGQSTTSTITPGQVNAGLVLFLLPKIMGDKVYLQITSSLSTLEKIQDIFSSGDASNAQKIQVPIISEKEFNQRSVITSGSTLILAGFKQVSSEANNSAMFQLNQLGGRGASIENVQTVVLITPYILNNDTE